MATICSINSIEKHAQAFVQHYLSKNNTEHSAETVLGAMSEVFANPSTMTSNSYALAKIEKLLEEAGISVDLTGGLSHNSQSCDFLSDYVIESDADIIRVFKNNQAGGLYILKRFAQQAFKYCIMDNSNSAYAIPFVTTNKLLQTNIAKWKNELVRDMLNAMNVLDPSTVSEILKQAGVSTVKDVTVFSETSGADVSLYESIMRGSKKTAQNEKLDTFDFLSGNMALRRILYSMTSLNNFDEFLELTMGDIVKPDRKLKGDLHRVTYERVGAVEGSQLDLMGISDYDYENALNYISASMEKIISSIPLVSVSLRSRTAKGIKRFSYNANGLNLNTLTIAHVLQSTAWLHNYLPELSKYLNIGSIDLLSNPLDVLFKALTAIHDFIEYEWDSKSNSSDLLVGQNLKTARSAVKKILKDSGPGLNTLMSLHEFLFNSKNRINNGTKSILQMLADTNNFAPQFNIIAEIAGQIISSVAPALAEYDIDGTLFDPMNSASPNSANYIQKSLKNKVMFSLRSDFRKSLLMTTLQNDRSYIDTIAKVTKSKKTLEDCLRLKEFKTAVAKIFGITNSNDIETFATLLVEAEQEFDGDSETTKNTLYNTFIALSNSMINLQTKWNSGTISSTDLYNEVTTQVNLVIGGLDLDVVGRALAPILSTAPTPTIVDRNGNLLGVYRTTSLVFMFPHMILRYKRAIKGEPLEDPDYLPLRQRCNILVDNKGLLEKGDNPMYDSTVSIPLTLGTELTNLEARKLPEFVQDLRQFMGDFMSLVNARQNNTTAAMTGIQLGTYSDKTTLPMLMFNLLTKQGNMPYTKAFLENPGLASRKMYGYLATQKLDLANKILTDWRKILLYISDHFDIIAKTWNLSNDEINALSRVVTSQLFIDLITEFPEDGILSKLASKEYSSQFKDIAHPKSARGNKKLDSTKRSSEFIKTTQRLYTEINNAQLLISEILKKIPGSVKLTVLNRAAHESNILLVDKLHYDKYTEVNELGNEISYFDVNRMLFDDVDIMCNQSIVNETTESDELILSVIEDFQSDDPNTQIPYELINSLSYPTRMVISALTKQYWIAGKKMSFYEYLKDYFTKHQDKILMMINADHPNSLGVLLFGKLYSKTEIKEYGHTKTIYEFNPLGLINVYRTYLLNTNFLRHQALDLSIKEAYEDKGADIDVVVERYNRQLTTSKRNNTMTAPIRAFALGLLNGVNQDTVNMVTVQDLPGPVFNTIGANTKLDEFDGCGFTSPYQARQESASLGKLRHVPVKKTFITPIHDYYAEELKWASNEITNQLMRESVGSEINLHKIYKVMHDFPLNCDITKRYLRQGSTQINIGLTLGQQYYAKEGFKYYRYDRIVSDGNLHYTIWRTEVDQEGNPVIHNGVPVKSEPLPSQRINSIFEIYESLNGLHGMSLVGGKLEYSESIHDFIYKLVTEVGEVKSGNIDPSKPLTQNDVHQPLRNGMIHILATNSSNKRGAANVVPNTLWTDPENTKLYPTKISLATGGELLDAEHEADLSKITKGTLLLLCLAQKGYDSALVVKVYSAIARAMQISSESFNEIEQTLLKNPNSLPEIIAKRVLESVEVLGNTLEIQTLLNAFAEKARINKEPLTFPLSLITKEVIKSIAPELNHVIKQKDSGLMGVLNAASRFVQVYNIGGQTFTLGSLMSDTGLLHILPYRSAIENYLSKHPDLTFDLVVSLLSIVSWNSNIDDELDIYSKDQKDENGNPKTFLIHEKIELLLDSVLKTYSFKELENEYLRHGSNRFLSYERISPTELQPGDWYYRPAIYNEEGELIREEGPYKLETPKLLLELILIDKVDAVYLCKHRPVDLQPQIRQVNTASYSENEYTSFEALFDGEVKWTIKNKQQTDNVDGLTNYLYSLDTSKLYKETKDFRFLQEDMVNFKNHVKAYGFTLKQQPNFEVYEGEVLNTYDWFDYYGGYDPTKDFEQLMLERIIAEYLNDPDKRILIVRGLTLASKVGTLSEKKKLKLLAILKDPLEVLSFCEKNPYFVFGCLPDDPKQIYTKYLQSHPEIFVPIESSSLRTALLIMPPIYKLQMKINGKNILELDLDHFKKANTFYLIPTHLTKNGVIDSDFIVRTFRGLYNIVVVDSLTDTSLLLETYGHIIVPTIKNGKRIDKRNKLILYNEPLSNYIICKRNGVETIILKNSETVTKDIYQLVKSDPALVSILPFLTHLNISNKIAVKKLINQTRELTTIPAFEDMYDNVLHMIDNGEIDSNLLVSLYNYVKGEYNEMYASSMYHSFLRSLDIIATRIPTQNMSSIMPMRVSSLINSSVNNVFVTKWQLWLLGADYDIDKAFLLGYNFDEKGMFIRWSNQQKFYNDEIFDASLQIPLPTGKTLVPNGLPELNLYILSTDGKTVDGYAESLISDYILIKKNKGNIIGLQTLAEKYQLSANIEQESIISDLLEVVIFGKLVDRIDQIGGLYITNAHLSDSNLFRLFERINSHNNYIPKVEGVNNYSTFITHQVLNDPRNATTTYKSIDIATDAFNNPIDEIDWGTVPGNIDDGHTISQTTASGAVGKDGVGIGANGTKVYLTLINYFSRGHVLDPIFDEEDLLNSPMFNVSKISLNYTDLKTKQPGNWTEYIGPISDTRLSPADKELYDKFILEHFDKDKRLYLYGRDAAQDVGALLSMAADNAKTLNLDKLHAETDYFAMHIYLAMIGVPPDVIISYFNSDTFKRVISMAQNDLISGQIPYISAQSFDPVEGMSDQERFDMAQLKQIYLAAKEITALAQILSINQGIKVEEEEIIAQRSRCEKVFEDTLISRGIKDRRFGLNHIQQIIQLDKNLPANKSQDQIWAKMQIANAAMDKVAGGMSLLDKFDFNRFLSDSDYANAVIAVYDVIKYNYNVFDVIMQVPHFLLMLKSYNNVLQAYSKSDKLLDFVLNQAPILYDEKIVNKTNPGSEFAPDLKVEKKFTKKLIPKAKGYFLQKVMNNFIINALDTYGFVFTPKSGPIIKCSFKTDNSLHRFVEFMNGAVIPLLIELNPNNAFLQGLEINELEVKETGIPFFGFSDNLRSLGHKDRLGTSKLVNIQQGFDAIKDIKLVDLLLNAGIITFKNDQNMTVGDALFLYNMLMRLASMRSNDLSPLFSSMNTLLIQKSLNDDGEEVITALPGTLQMLYLEYIRRIDLGLEPIEFDKHEFMAYLYKNASFTYPPLSGIRNKLIKFNGLVDPIIFKLIDNNKQTVKYSRFLVGMDYVEDNMTSVINAERFISAYLNGIIEVFKC